MKKWKLAMLGAVIGLLLVLLVMQTQRNGQYQKLQPAKNCEVHVDLVYEYMRGLLAGSVLEFGVDDEKIMTCRLPAGQLQIRMHHLFLSPGRHRFIIRIPEKGLANELIADIKGNDKWVESGIEDMFGEQPVIRQGVADEAPID